MVPKLHGIEYHKAPLIFDFSYQHINETVKDGGLKEDGAK